MAAARPGSTGPASVDAIEAVVRGFFEASSGDAIAVYLFGSVARGTARSWSDIDLAVLYREPPPRVLGALPQRQEAALEKRVGCAVQVVALNTAPPDLVHRVLRDGKLLLDRDRSARIRFEVPSRNAYFDMEPVRRRYRHGDAPP